MFAGLISNPGTLYVQIRYGGNQSRVTSTFRCDSHDYLQPFSSYTDVNFVYKLKMLYVTFIDLYIIFSYGLYLHIVFNKEYPRYCVSVLGWELHDLWHSVEEKFLPILAGKFCELI